MWTTDTNWRLTCRWTTFFTVTSTTRERHRCVRSELPDARGFVPDGQASGNAAMGGRERSRRPGRYYDRAERGFIVRLCVSQTYAVGETVTAVENERRYVCPVTDEERL